MKKLVALALVAGLLSFVGLGCGDTGTKGGSKASSTQTPTKTSQETKKAG